jgi:RNA polymerase sigma factor (sigma-70 family)
MKKKKNDKRRGDHFVDQYSCSLSYGRRKRGRIRYLNWAAELFGCRDREIEGRILEDSSRCDKESDMNASLNQRVRKAVKKLPFDERQFVQLFYFEFKSYQEISRKSKKSTHKLERIHHRALGKLRILLAGFVQERFKLEISEDTDCIICKSPFRRELNELIRKKAEDETYSRLIKIFKQKYGIVIRTPQVIIGHVRKHMV